MVKTMIFFFKGIIVLTTDTKTKRHLHNSCDRSIVWFFGVPCQGTKLLIPYEVKSGLNYFKECGIQGIFTRIGTQSAFFLMYASVGGSEHEMKYFHREFSVALTSSLWEGQPKGFISSCFIQWERDEKSWGVMIGRLCVHSPISMEPIKPIMNPAVWYRGKLR